MHMYQLLKVIDNPWPAYKQNMAQKYQGHKEVKKQPQNANSQQKSKRVLDMTDVYGTCRGNKALTLRVGERLLFSQQITVNEIPKCMHTGSAKLDAASA